MSLIEQAQRVIVLAAIVLVAGCAAPAPSTPVLPSGEFALPTEPAIALPSGAVDVCAGIGIDTRLHGAATDSHIAWLVDSDGVRIEALWPADYRARFNPSLEVVDPTGAVVLREGEIVSTACVTGDPQVLLLEPRFTE